MRCGFCGTEFDAAQAASACAGCPVARDGCRLVRCPRCGYEMPPEAKLVGWLRGLRRRIKALPFGLTAEVNENNGIQ